MEALTLEDLEVLVLFSLEAVLLSCTRMVMRSPKPWARLSANIERAVGSFHREPGPAEATSGRSNAATVKKNTFHGPRPAAHEPPGSRADGPSALLHILR